MNSSNLSTAHLNEGVGLITCERTFCMAERANSPGVRGFGGIGLSPRDGWRRDGTCRRTGKGGT